MDERRRQAYLDWVVYDGDWYRPDRGRLGYTIHQAPITGPMGELIEQAVQSQFEGGRGRETIDEQTGQAKGVGYPLRWERLLQMVQPAWNVSQLLAGKEGPGRNAPLYRDTTRIGGLESVAWQAIRAHVGLDAVLVEKQALSVALASAGVGVVIDDPRYPPTLQAYAPHEVTLLPYAWNPRQCAIAIHHRARDRVVVSDISDHRRPIYGEWASASAWQAGRPPLWSLEGAAYPFRWAGEVLTHIIPVQGRMAPGCLQPSGRGLRQLTLDTILELGWVRLVSRVGSFNRVVIASESSHRPEGLEELSLDPVAVSAVWGGKVSLQTVGHSVDAAEKLYRIAMDDIQTHLSMLDGDLRMRATQQGVQSGRAIEIEREGAEDYAKDQMRVQRPSDQRIVGLLCATWNWQVRHRLVDPGLIGLDGWHMIPEERPVIEYPLRWSQHEREGIAARMEPTDPVGAEMVRRGLDTTDDDARDEVYLDLKRASEQRVALVRAGYSVPVETLYASPPASVDETVTYTPPTDVAATASRGLQLQAEYRSRWGGLAARDLLARARRLQAQEPMTLGQVRELHTWLEAHAADGETGSDGDGSWGDAADPSGDWIRWLSQGGEDAQVWCGGVLP